MDQVVTLPVGVAHATATITILDDDDAEDDEQFTVTLLNPVGSTLGTQETLVVTIVDDDTVTE
jgi:hypothetical protein